MFSGIAEETGVVEKVARQENLSTLFIRGGKTATGAKAGDSICVSGVCLTVTRRQSKVFSFDIMKETLEKTTLGSVGSGSRVNLERALKVSDRISGHFVSGHVDHMETVRAVITLPNYVEIQVTTQQDLAKYIVPKGSVCIDGVSLTVGAVRRNFFSVYLIPFTLEVTTLGLLKKGDRVNIETDILAKYVLARDGQSDNPYIYKKRG
ncbi:MAG: riboflavin synthase [Candidatus Omnitrophica bacterium]|nr:riboflavin synthase [Candidatus Omnitrophota bacterium]